MKKSNKLLLGGLLTLLLFITAIHLSLYAKYKAGDYTVFNPDDDLTSLSMQQYPNILFVSLQNIPVGTVKFSDVAQVEKDADDGLQYVRKGDTLQITGKAGQEEPQRPVTFYLPHNATLSLFNSSLSFTTDKKAVQSDPIIFLQKSTAVFPAEQGQLQLGHLRIVASENSLAAFQNNTRIDHLDIHLSKSALESSEGNFGQLSIVTDSLSHIALPAKQLLKANIRTTIQE